MLTIREVAELAGVTAATVSNVLRERGKVGAETRKRVLAAIETLGYRPNLTARALAEGSAPTLALLVSSIANPFYPEFALAAERAARKNGRYLIVCNTNDDPLVGRTYLEQIAGTLSDGVLVTNANLDFDDLRAAQRRGTAVVLCMWERPDVSPGLPCIAVDFAAAGALAAEHLRGLGHEHVGVIVGSQPNGVQSARYEGFRSAFAGATRAHEFDDPFYTADTVEAGYRAANALIAKFPQVTAIFATNDLPALGAINAAIDAGLKVPDEISIIGITDIRQARESRPALTTVAVPTDEAAEMAVEMLRSLGKPSEAGLAPMQIAPQPTLVLRKSTGSANQRASRSSVRRKAN